MPTRRSSRPRRTRRRAPRGAAWLAVALLAVVALLPSTRAVAATVLVRIDDAVAIARAGDARERAVAVLAFRYGISRGLADDIERAAAAEGVPAELAFRLVRVESDFRERAVSPAGALGLTQLMPATARELQPGIGREAIFQRETNLRLGFRYLRWLLDVYEGDVELALTAYNRGPGTVARIRGAGGDPGNGYAELVLGARGGSAVGGRPADSPAVPAHPLHESAPARLPEALR